MSQIHRESAAERVAKELIEADVEIVFNLADMAQAEFVRGDRSSASRALNDAENVLLDIERRLNVIGSRDRQPFDPLVSELKRAIAIVKSGETERQ